MNTRPFHLSFQIFSSTPSNIWIRLLFKSQTFFRGNGASRKNGNRVNQWSLKSEFFTAENNLDLICFLIIKTWWGVFIKIKPANYSILYFILFLNLLWIVIDQIHGTPPVTARSKSILKSILKTRVYQPSLLTIFDAVNVYLIETEIHFMPGTSRNIRVFTDFTCLRSQLWWPLWI